MTPSHDKFHGKILAHSIKQVLQALEERRVKKGVNLTSIPSVLEEMIFLGIKDPVCQQRGHLNRYCLLTRGRFRGNNGKSQTRSEGNEHGQSNVGSRNSNGLPKVSSRRPNGQSAYYEWLGEYVNDRIMHHAHKEEGRIKTIVGTTMGHFVLGSMTNLEGGKRGDDPMATTPAPIDTDAPIPPPIPNSTLDSHIPWPSSPPLVEPECIDIQVIESSVRPCPPTPPRQLSPINEDGSSHRSPSPPFSSPLSRIPPLTPSWLKDVDENLPSLPIDPNTTLSSSPNSKPSEEYTPLE
ncbi:uncharacterized protein LOC113866900 [Abrus precatorius]|uniref:Uncharacterized protein LOC113866900 n=1 Tax=Abrus precatorius TaxID=3816 RepID=A0A8B8LRJ6_ABRPR|nr:uncharacterized protein LOC113866900 [Abrus precatorius]